MAVCELALVLQLVTLAQLEHRSGQLIVCLAEGSFLSTQTRPFVIENSSGGRVEAGLLVVPHIKNETTLSGAREPPQFQGQVSAEGILLASNQFRESLRELLRESGFAIPRIAPRIPRNSESCSENGLFTLSVFFKLGWFPGF